MYAFCCIFFLRDFLMRFCAFLPLWDVLVAFCCIPSLWDSVLFGRYEVLVRFYALCCIIFVRDIVIRFLAFLDRYELCVWDFMLVWSLRDVMMRFYASWLPIFLFWWCDVRTVERHMLKDAGGRVYKLGGWMAGKECKFCGGGWCKCESVGKHQGLYGMYYIQANHIFLHDVTWREHALVSKGGSLGCFGWWIDVCNFKNVLPSFGCHSIVIRVIPFAFVLARWLWM